MAKTKVRGKNRDNNRRAKKKVSFLTTEGITYVDWKNDKLLRKFMSERAKIRARRVTGNNAQQQKLVADAIKLAREMALVPYSNRVTTQRQNKDRDGRGRAAGPLPRPSAPPPSSASGEDADEDATVEDHVLGRRGCAGRRRHRGPGMKVVLRADVEGLGRKGEVCDVAAGYARNYLVPKGLALKSSPGAELQAEAMRRSAALRRAADRADADRDRREVGAVRAVPCRPGPQSPATCTARWDRPRSWPRWRTR